MLADEMLERAVGDGTEYVTAVRTMTLGDVGEFDTMDEVLFVHEA